MTASSKASARDATSGDPRGELWFRLFRSFWLALVLLSVPGAVASTYSFQRLYREYTRPVTDFGLRTARVGGLVRLREVYGAASTVRPGDAIILVNGRPAPEAYSQVVSLGRLLGAGPVATIRTRSKDGAIREHVLTRSDRLQVQGYGRTGVTPGLLNLEVRIAQGAANLAMLVTGIVLFVRRPREAVAAVLSMAMLLLAATGSTGPFNTFVATPWMPAWGLLQPAVAALGWSLLFLAVFLFPSGRFNPRWTRWV
ncbi:MAG TPA: hypothetical protein VGC92_13885, partial [Phenylobacterium sp.]